MADEFLMKQNTRRVLSGIAATMHACIFAFRVVYLRKGNAAVNCCLRRIIVSSKNNVNRLFVDFATDPCHCVSPESAEYF